MIGFLAKCLQPLKPSCIADLHEVNADRFLSIRNTSLWTVPC